MDASSIKLCRCKIVPYLDLCKIVPYLDLWRGAAQRYLKKVLQREKNWHLECKNLTLDLEIIERERLNLEVQSLAEVR